MRPYTFLILINFHWSLFHTCRLRLKKKRRSVMAQSIPSVPFPPPPPRAFVILFWKSCNYATTVGPGVHTNTRGGDLKMAYF